LDATVEEEKHHHHLSRSKTKRTRQALIAPLEEEEEEDQVDGVLIPFSSGSDDLAHRQTKPIGSELASTLVGSPPFDLMIHQHTSLADASRESSSHT
jgi:hypothetical protein